mgnify:CR=1 FL=1
MTRGGTRGDLDRSVACGHCGRGTVGGRNLLDPKDGLQSGVARPTGSFDPQFGLMEVIDHGGLCTAVDRHQGEGEVGIGERVVAPDVVGLGGLYRRCRERLSIS